MTSGHRRLAGCQWLLVEREDNPALKGYVRGRSYFRALLPCSPAKGRRETHLPSFLPTCLPQLSRFPTVPREGVTFVSDKKAMRLPPITSLLTLHPTSAVFTGGDLSTANRESLYTSLRVCVELLLTTGSSPRDDPRKAYSPPPPLSSRSPSSLRKRDAYRFIILRGEVRATDINEFRWNRGCCYFLANV